MRKFTYIIFCISVFALQFYAQQPTMEWERRYNGLVSGGASGLSVKLDNTGNVYVLTSISTPTTLGDYGLIKYSPSGSLLWEAVYNSPGNLSDNPKAFAVTSAGDVYITGNSGINFVEHITTVKFNSNGILQWANEFNGGFYDIANDLALDNHGNILICGGSAVNNNISYALAIKYSPSGDSLWVRKYTQYQFSYTGNLVTDDSSNVYTSGYYTVNTSQSNYLTLKYNKNGDLIWYSSYGVTGYGAIANSIAIDSNRNVYVVGVLNVPQPSFWDNVLVKINPNGILQWAKNYTGISGNHACSGTPTGVSVTPDGSRIYYTTACGTSLNSREFITLSYNSFGDSLWVRRYPIGGTGIPQNNPADLKLDRYGSVYIAGYVNNLDAGAIIKYSENGTLQWITATDSSNPKSIYIDTIFNIYYAGTGGFNNISNAVTIKYSQVIGIINNNNELPVSYKLYQNYPNPFNAVTVVTYEVPKSSKISLYLHDVTGKIVKTLENKIKEAGYYSIIINMNDLASGIYFYSLKSNNVKIDTKKMVLVK